MDEFSTTRRPAHSHETLREDRKCLITDLPINLRSKDRPTPAGASEELLHQCYGPPAGVMGQVPLLILDINASISRDCESAGQAEGTMASTRWKPGIRRLQGLLWRWPRPTSRVTTFPPAKGCAQGSNGPEAGQAGRCWRPMRQRPRAASGAADRQADSEAWPVADQRHWRSVGTAVPGAGFHRSELDSGGPCAARIAWPAGAMPMNPSILAG